MTFSCGEIKVLHISDLQLCAVIPCIFIHILNIKYVVKYTLFAASIAPPTTPGPKVFIGLEPITSIKSLQSWVLFGVRKVAMVLCLPGWNWVQHVTYIKNQSWINAYLNLKYVNRRTEIKQVWWRQWCSTVWIGLGQYFKIRDKRSLIFHEIDKAFHAEISTLTCSFEESEKYSSSGPKEI